MRQNFSHSVVNHGTNPVLQLFNVQVTITPRSPHKKKKKWGGGDDGRGSVLSLIVNLWTHSPQRSVGVTCLKG